MTAMATDVGCANDGFLLDVMRIGPAIALPTIREPGTKPGW